jgi:hypothetical protein
VKADAELTQASKCSAALELPADAAEGNPKKLATWSLPVAVKMGY